MSDWNLSDLENWDDKICEIAKSHGLDWYPITYETCDYFEMLGNMSFKTFSKTKGQIFFPNRQQNLKAFYNDTLGVGKAQIKREFFSVGKKEEDKAVKIFTDTMMRDLRL